MNVCRLAMYPAPLTALQYTVCRASVKLFEFGVRTPVGLFLGAWYAAGIDLRRFRTLSLQIFGIIGLLGILETTKRYKWL